MAFSTDRDLLALEPNVFVDVPLASQQLLRAEDAVVDGTTLSSATSNFAAVDIAAGGVLVASGLTLEVVQRIDAQTLTVSLPRGGVDDPPLAPPLNGTVEITARTFAPQAAAAHARLRRVLGLTEDGSNASMLIASEQARHIEVLGTLAEIYRIAQGPLGDNDAFAARQHHYERAFAAAVHGLGVPVDVLGDGTARQWSHAGTRTLKRV